MFNSQRYTDLRGVRLDDMVSNINLFKKYFTSISTASDTVLSQSFPDFRFFAIHACLFSPSYRWMYIMS